MSPCKGNKVSLIQLSLGWPGETCDLEGPLDYLGIDGGGGVGAGPGISVGAALALQGTGMLPLTVLGDGDFMMGCQALWTASHMEIPLLPNHNSFYRLNSLPDTSLYAMSPPIVPRKRRCNDRKLTFPLYRGRRTRSLMMS